MYKFMTSQAQGASVDFASPDHQFEIPSKKINDEVSLQKFLSSATSMDLAMFIVECQKAVKSSKMTKTELPPKMSAFMDYLQKIYDWLDEVPPIDQPMRFGNKAFRTWMDKIIESAEADLLQIC